MAWLGTGQFRRAGAAVLPYYRHYVPHGLRAAVPVRLRHLGKAKLVAPPPKSAYEEWIRANDTLSDDDRRLIRSHIAALSTRPTFSILMPVYNPPVNFLCQAIDSVLDQLYGDWELCIVDDASTSTEIRKTIEGYAASDRRIKPLYRPVNGGISAATNTGLATAGGDWLVLMDHDDLLSEHALYLVAEAIDRNPDAAIFYSDEDRLNPQGERYGPYFKSDWDYDLFLGLNLVSHLGVYRMSLARKVGGFREGFEGSQDWDFALRVLDASPVANVQHIPFVLYHWRQFEATFSSTSLQRARAAAQRAVNEHFVRIGVNATAEPEGHSSHLHVKRPLPADRPLVSIIIPTKNKCDLLRACIDGIDNRTGYRPVELVVVDNGSDENDALAFLTGLRQRNDTIIVDDAGPFNFSRLVNRGVAASSGKVCVLLNNDVDVINPQWLEELVSHALRPDVGAVGAKLYYPDDSIQHGGAILGVRGVAAHVHKGAPRNSPGYFNRLNMTHNLSCVTAACLAVRRKVFDEIGGFNERDLKVAFNDVDFCIRVRQGGYKVIWTPHAELYHFESVSRGSDATPENAARFRAEIDYMRKVWEPILDNDPSYNRNLSLQGECFDLDGSTRVRRPWRHLDG
jgi:glycosyltransferase involved in cell wall biosynthesis